MNNLSANDGMHHGYCLDEISGIGFFRADSLKALGIDHGFTARTGGVSQGPYESLNLGWSREEPNENIRENFGRMCRAIGIPYGSMVMNTYEHGARVEAVTSLDAGRGFDRESLPFCDAIVTDDPELTLVTTHADCAAVFLYDPVHNAAGLAHAGWKGTLLRVGQKTAEKLTACYQTNPKDIIAVIGPCICQKCFEVGEEVAEKFRAEFRMPCCVPGKPGKSQLDIAACLAEQLLDAGAVKEHITKMDACTYELSSLLYSYRRDRGVTGSMAAYLRVPHRKK